MLSAATQSRQNINFGTTERLTNLKLGGSGIRGRVSNASYFTRPEYHPIDAFVRPLIDRANAAKTVEWKVWGCSDLSGFLSKMMSIHKQMGKEAAAKKFDNVELIDIDFQIVSRAKRRLVGLTDFDKEEIEDSIGVNPHDYFVSSPHADFFLPDEPTVVQGMNQRGVRKLLEEKPQARNMPDFLLELLFVREVGIVPHRISDDLMRGTVVRQGDIRKEMKSMPENTKDGNLRIVDFSNAWYFMNPGAQVGLACDMSRKMKQDDVLIVGNVEKGRGVGKVLKQVGFEPSEDSPVVFVKKEKLSPIELFKKKAGLLWENPIEAD